MSARRTILEGRETPCGAAIVSSAGTEWKELPGGVTAPEGFLAGGVHCGIRKNRPDLALLVATGGAAAAGVFTTHRLPAPPVVLARRHHLSISISPFHALALMRSFEPPRT